MAIQQHKANILLITLLLIPLFWLIETLAKIVQRVFIARYNKIEYFLRDKSQLSMAWEKGTFPDLNFPDFTARYSVQDIKKKINVFRCAITPYTSLLYLMQLAMTGILYCGFSKEWF